MNGELEKPYFGCILLKLQAQTAAIFYQKCWDIVGRDVVNGKSQAKLYMGVNSQCEGSLKKRSYKEYR